jgi:hypothetical protein
MSSTNWLAGTRLASLRHDEAMLGLVFVALILVTVTVLGRDLVEQIRNARTAATLTMPGDEPFARPDLPSARPDIAPGRERRRTSDAPELQRAMTIELASDGRLELTGVITPGTYERFEAELKKRAEYVRTIVLNSPGGSVQDALAMAKLIRERGFETLVGENGLCASSCPLVFSGGVKRVAEPGAALGVHQMTALLPPGVTPDRGDGMARAQSVSAECQRLLLAMGVDPRVWLHAMETPPEQIFYFTDREVIDFKLATEHGGHLALSIL